MTATGWEIIRSEATLTYYCVRGQALLSLLSLMTLNMIPKERTEAQRDAEFKVIPVSMLGVPLGGLQDTLSFKN